MLLALGFNAAKKVNHQITRSLKNWHFCTRKTTR